VGVSLLQGSCEGGKYACAPLPPYLEAEQPDTMEEEEEEEPKRPLHDLCFHLLKLYSDRWAAARHESVESRATGVTSCFCQRILTYALVV